jgi:hypothetical protein
MGIASLAKDPPRNVPLYRAEDNVNTEGRFPIKVLYQMLKTDATNQDLLKTANKIAQVRLFVTITPLTLLVIMNSYSCLSFLSTDSHP